MMDRIVLAGEMKELTGLSSSYLRGLEAVGAFPRRFKLDPNGSRNGPVGWMLSDIRDWMKNPAAWKFRLP